MQIQSKGINTLRFQKAFSENRPQRKENQREQLVNKQVDWPEKQSLAVWNGLKPLSLVRFAASQAYTYSPEQNVVFDLRHKAKTTPQAEMFRVAAPFAREATRVTTSELYRQSLQLAHVLKTKYKVGPGDRVAAIETNTPEFVRLMYATLALGGSIVPVNIIPLADKQGAREKLAHMLKISDCKTLFIGKVIADNPDFKSILELKQLEPLLNPKKRFIIKSVLPVAAKATRILPGTGEKLRRIRQSLQEKADKIQSEPVNYMVSMLPKGMKVILPSEVETLMQKNPMAQKNVEALEKAVKPVLNPDPDQEAVLLYSSGTTGMPKGVPISHRALVHNVEALKSVTPEIGTDDNLLVLLPLFHIFGMSVLMTGLSKGAKNVLVPSTAEAARNPDKLLETVARENITVLPAIPKLLEGIMNQPDAADKLKSVKIAISGGEKLPHDIYQQFKALRPDAILWEGYGMTEAGILTVNKSDRYGNVGVPVSPHVELDLQEKNGQGIGALRVRTPSLTKGYLGEDASQAAFQPGGWFDTGDMGHVDEEGTLSLVGRNKEIIKRGGEILGPLDFDRRLKDLLPVKDVMTLSYVPPGTDRERVLSVVLLPPGAQETQSSLMTALSAQVASGQLEPRYNPHMVLPLVGEAFPEGFLSPLGKNQYKNVRAYVDNLSQAGVIRFETGNLTILKPERLTQ